MSLHPLKSVCLCSLRVFAFFFQAEDGIRDFHVTGVQTCALPISKPSTRATDKTAPAPVPGRAWLMLALATLGFAVNFWAWALLSPLGPRFHDELALSSFESSLLVAVPVVVGSLGRIPVGALTDRFGGRAMFPLVS